MAISVPVTWDLLVWAGGFALLGWNLWINAEKRAFEKDFALIQAALSKAEGKIEMIEKAYLTREDHKEFKNEVLILIEKMGETLTLAIDKLGVRVEKIVEERRLE